MSGKMCSQDQTKGSVDRNVLINFRLSLSVRKIRKKVYVVEITFRYLTGNLVVLGYVGNVQCLF